MAPADAQLLWLSAKVPNDQFLLYAFDGALDESVLDEIGERARRCPDLCVRVRDDHPWRYPRWVAAEVVGEQFVVHEARDWQGCLDGVAALGQLDATAMCWRVHLFAPDAVVVQVCHALGDGSRSSALAAILLGRPAVASGAGPRPPRRGFLPWRAVAAARAHRRLVGDTDAGLLPPPAALRPPLSVNERPGATPVLRTLVVDRTFLRRPTVTIAALGAIGEALGGYLSGRGEDIDQLGAELPMALPPVLQGYNNFRNAGVGLYPTADRERRVQRIAHDVAGQRSRAWHPATVAAARASAAVPAWLVRWGISRFDPGTRCDAVTGNTVVSSVNRGPADLHLGGRRVRMTAGFPALSPMMSLTHGVHGIGETVTVSVRADPSNVDVDDYLDRLRHALGCRG